MKLCGTVCGVAVEKEQMGLKASFTMGDGVDRKITMSFNFGLENRRGEKFINDSSIYK